MNRRNFLKTTGLVGISSLFVPTILTGNVVDNELDDLYNYLESKSIWNPIKGHIPFKLYPYQKDILKHIHQNDKLVIVKCRQIGMTTLLAGYAAWVSHRKNTLDFYISPHLPYSWDYYQNIKINTFGGKKDYYPPTGNIFCIGFDDEYNHEMDNLNYWESWMTGRVHLNENNEKHIIAGTVDKLGNMDTIIKLADNNPDWKVVYYPWWECNPVWNADRVEITLDSNGMEIYELNAFCNNVNI